MITDIKFKEGTGTKYGEDAPKHRLELSIEITDPTPEEIGAMRSLLNTFFTEIGMKKNE